jgi:hypothetical protein
MEDFLSPDVMNAATAEAASLAATLVEPPPDFRQVRFGRMEAIRHWLRRAAIAVDERAMADRVKAAALGGVTSRAALEEDYFKMIDALLARLQGIGTGRGSLGVERAMVGRDKAAAD